MYGAMQQMSPKALIAANLRFLLTVYDVSRKQVCEDLKISYTTFCDWYNAKTYPRIDNLENLSYYFRIETRDFFLDLEKNERMVGRLTAYAEALGVRKDDESEADFTVADYNETPEGYPVELINGQFFVMESPNIRHQKIVYELGFEIGSYIKKHKGKCRVFPGPFDVELPTRKATVAVPDITVICDSSILNEKRCVGTPDWIIEVLSKTTGGKDKKEKLSAYEESRVPLYWIVDQFSDKVAVYRLTEIDGMPTYEEPDWYAFTDSIPVDLYPELSICLAELDI